MTALRVFVLRVRGLFAKDHPARLDEEIESHLLLMAAEYERRGMTAAEARAAARRQFGGVAQMRESYREQRRLPFFDTLAQDLSYALRQWRKSPLFASAAIVTLALGIGANTAVFRALDAVALRALPGEHPERLVCLELFDRGRPGGRFNYPWFRELAAHSEILEGATAIGDAMPKHTALTGRGAIKIEDVRLVSGNYFHTLGVNCPLGRALTGEDDRPGAPAAAVVSYAFWQHQLNGAADVLGQTLELDSVRATIVGVAPPRFFGERVLFGADVWLPMSLQPSLMSIDWLKSGNQYFLDVMARLRPGVTIRQAQSVLAPHYRRLVTQDGDDNGAATLRIVPGGHGIVIADIQNSVTRPLWVLLGAVALLLLIACCNLANLLLARGAARTHEIGVRLALGAGRARLVRQLLTESLLLAAFGCGAGILLAEWGGRLLAQLGELSDLNVDISLNWEILAFNAAVCVAAAAVLGLVPALAGSRLDLRSALQASRRNHTGLPRQLPGTALVVAQVALSVTLLSGATLLGRSLWNMRHQEFGFRSQGLLLADMEMDWSRDFGDEAARRFATLQPLVLEKLGALPGVRSVALSQGGPFSHGSSTSQFSVLGRQPRPQDNGNVVWVSPGYFETMGIPLLAGRAIAAADAAQGPKVVVIGKSAARTLFGSANPVGRYLSLSPHFDPKGAMQVVGVAGDVRLSASSDKSHLLVFVPLAQMPFFFSSIALRTAAPVGVPSGVPSGPGAGPLAAALRQALADVDGNLKVTAVRPVDEIVDDQTDLNQTLSLLTGVFGGLAMLLASVGVYGLLAYEVQRRTQEISIRMALGASQSQVIGLVMGQLGRWLALGTAIGSIVALCAGSAMRSLLFGITAWDSRLLAAAVLVLVLVAAAAAFLPARRAARLNPLEGLRQE